MRGLCIVFAIIGCSCTVTNNLYVSNPVPVEKGNVVGFVGLGTGIEPKIESISPDGTVKFFDEITTAPIIAFGAQIGISDHADLRLAGHIPFIVGGFGLRAGFQQSLFDADSPLNIAIGIDLGFVVSRDSLTILKSSSEINKATNGAINGDIFLPIAWSRNDFSIILTSRYSVNTMYVRENENESKGKPFNLNVPIISLGIKYKKAYFETSAVFRDKTIYPHFGIAYMLVSKE